MLHAPIHDGEGAARSPIRLRALSLGSRRPVHDTGTDGGPWRDRTHAGLRDLRRYRLGAESSL